MKKTFWKKMLSLTLVVLMVCLALPILAADDYSVWDGSIETDWLKDSEKTHIIDSAAKLAGLAKLTNDQAIGGDTGAYEGHTFYITVNIDLNGKEWAPIGYTYGVNFAGNLEGKLGGVEGAAVTIKNLVISDNTNNNNTGFIGTLRGGSVKNLTFVNAKVDYPQGSSQGIVVGYISKVITAIENIKVIDSYVSASASTTEGTGGVIGYAKVDEPLTFKNVAFINGTVEADTKYAGGIIGQARTNAEGAHYTFENCYVSGKITGNVDDAGGIAGTLMHKFDNDCFTLKNVQADNVTVKAATAGGTLVGRLTGTTLVIENALVTDSGEWVGEAAGTVDATDCYSNNDKAIFDGETPLKVSKNDLTDLAAKTTLAGFDFDSAWLAREGATAILRVAKADTDVEAGVVEVVDTATTGTTTVTTAPATWDGAVIAAVTAVLSGLGFTLAGKKR